MRHQSWDVLASPDEVTIWFFLVMFFSQIIIAIFWTTQPRRKSRKG